MGPWVYEHRDLGEPLHADGSPILRPVVPLVVASDVPAVLGVIDSGSPVSVGSADLFGWLGVDLDATEPLYEIPLSVGGRFDRTPVFRVELGLRPPDDQSDQPAIEWTLELGARRG